MAFKRKRIKDQNGALIETPQICYVCKERKALHRMHGGLVSNARNYGGKNCCDDCAPRVRAEEDRLQAGERPGDFSEGEYQAYGHLFN